MRTPAWLVALVAVASLVAGCGTDGSANGSVPSPVATPTAAGATKPPATGVGATATPAGPRKLGVSIGAETTAAAPDFEPLPDAKAYFGTLGRSVYRIEVPNRWNGDLVLWAHGFRGFGTEVSTENPRPAFRQLLVGQGYAWAASSFGENGYAPGIGADDTLSLKQYFTQQFGRPQRTYIAGASMGGNVVSLSLENFPDEYDGGLSLCGAIAGEEQIDYLVAWAMAAEFIGGLEFPFGEGQAKVNAVLQTYILPALGPVESPTTKGKAFASVVRNLTGGPRPFFNEGYREQYALNFALVVSDPDRSSLTVRAATNESADYRSDPGLGFDGDLLNRAVRRLPAEPSIRSVAAYPDKAPTTGKIKDPLVTLHNTGDLFVPISAEQSYRKKADAAGSGDLLVQRIIRDGGHCKFNDTEIAQAWNGLVAWVTEKKKPAGDDVLGDLSDAGRTFTSPLRPNDPGNR